MYYYSPIWLYCLGIVDKAEDRLYAYLYDESCAKKGANNVASILLYHIITFVLDNFRYSQNIGELNIIMDNCGGQNKNGTVLKMAAYFVERGWFNKVNLIFLIKGHTKNSCDRMFNLLKVQWHHSNVYTFEQALQVLDAVENIMPIDASNIHIDYASLLEKWYKQPVARTIQENHIFFFDKQTISNCIMTTKRSHNAAVTSTQSIKRTDKYPNDTICKLDILYLRMQFLAKPGLKPIKQVHLYTKWRSVVPHPYKDITCPLPSNEIIQMVLKRKPKKKNKQTTDAATTTTVTTTVGTAITTTVGTSTTAAVTTTTPATRTPRSRRKLKEQETRTIEVEGKPVDVHPDEVGSSDEGSEYVDSFFDPLEQLEQQFEPRQTRGKQFLPPKPAAVLTKETKKERAKDLAENKKDIKERNKQITKRRINTRNQKKIGKREKRTSSKATS